MVGDEGEEFRTDRRGFGTDTFHNEAEGRLMDGVCRGSGKDTPLMDPLLLKLL